MAYGIFPILSEQEIKKRLSCAVSCLLEGLYERQLLAVSRPCRLRFKRPLSGKQSFINHHSSAGVDPEEPLTDNFKFGGFTNKQSFIYRSDYP